MLLKNKVKNVDAITTISETSKKDIVRFLKVPAEKVHVIYLAPSESFSKIRNNKELIKVRTKYNLPMKFVLYMGDVNYNKNLPTLLEACKIAGIELVICGKQAREVSNGNWVVSSGPRDLIRKLLNQPHPELAHLAILKDLLNNKGVHCLGFVPEEDLEGIFKLAEVYCQPSYYEGFGLPVLVAMSVGCPVVIAKTNSLVEIAGGAALIADPQNASDFADKINSVVKDANLRAHLIREGEKRVKEFSWEKCAKETIEVYKIVVGSK